MNQEAGAGAEGDTSVANAEGKEGLAGAQGDDDGKQKVPEGFGDGDEGDGKGKEAIKGDEFDWRDHLPQDMKDDIVFKDVKNIGSLAKQFKDAQSFIGDSVRIPGEDASPEEVDQFFNKLGRPASAKDYHFELPELQGNEWDKDNIQEFTKVFHEAGVTQGQADIILNGYARMNNEIAVKAEEGIGESITQLKESWGPNFERNLNLAQRAVEHLGGQEAKDIFNVSGVGSHPVLVEMFANIGRQLAEDNIITGEAAGVMNTDDAKQKIASINADKEHAYWKPSAPGHAEAKEEMRKLFQLAYD